MLYRLLSLLFLVMPIQSLCMDYNESAESEVYTFINGDEKITATRFKKGGNFLVIKRSASNSMVVQAKYPQRVFLRLELEYGELTDSQSDPE